MPKPITVLPLDETKQAVNKTTSVLPVTSQPVFSIPTGGIKAPVKTK